MGPLVPVVLVTLKRLQESLASLFHGYAPRPLRHPAGSRLRWRLDSASVRIGATTGYASNAGTGQQSRSVLLDVVCVL
jgi:hypothetical protein